jgi:heme exporter protein B
MSESVAFVPLVKQLLKCDLLMAWRRSVDVITPLVFFVMVVALFPLAVGNDRTLLAAMGPGIIWVAAVIAIILGLKRFLQSDYEDGALELLLLSPQPLVLLMLVRVLAHWMLTALPLLIIAPLLGMMLQLSWYAIVILMASLALGTPILCLVGAIGAGLTLSLRHNSVLLSLLVLPLFIPVLVFGASSVTLAEQGYMVLGHLAVLAALLLLSLCLTPFAISFAVRVGAE